MLVVIDLTRAISTLHSEVVGLIYSQKSADRLIRIPYTREYANSRTSCNDSHKSPFPPVLERREAVWEGYDTQESRFHEPLSHHGGCAVLMVVKHD
jgi:hypothetical protein